MSRHSAEITFWFTKGDTSFYFWGKKNGDEIKEIHLARPFRLTAIIHEINECEVTNLLARKEFAEETNGRGVIVINARVMVQTVKNFGCIKLRNGVIKPSVFSRINDVVFVSHMISPYATRNGFMPRRKYRVFW